MRTRPTSPSARTPRPLSTAPLCLQDTRAIRRNRTQITRNHAPAHTAARTAFFAPDFTLGSLLAVSQGERRCHTHARTHPHTRTLAHTHMFGHVFANHRIHTVRGGRAGLSQRRCANTCPPFTSANPCVVFVYPRRTYVYVYNAPINAYIDGVFRCRARCSIVAPLAKLSTIHPPIHSLTHSLSLRTPKQYGCVRGATSESRKRSRLHWERCAVHRNRTNRLRSGCGGGH